jgi:hypothetical protein
VIISLSIFLSACNQPSDSDEDVGTLPGIGTSEPGMKNGETDYRSNDILPTVSQEQMIVRNGDIRLVVEDVLGTGEEIVNLVNGLNGYVVSSRFWDEGHDIMGHFSIRVPDESFDTAMTTLGNMAERVASESTDSHDVTQEYIDLDARLRNAEATEGQYLNLLDKAVSVEDTLRIYENLSRVRAEIEQIKGRMLYLERISSTSLINIYLEPEKSNEPWVIGNWSIGEAFKSVIQGVVILGQWLVTGLMWLAVFSPIWGGLLIWILTLRRRRKQGA